MARGLIWLRGNWEYANSAAESNVHIVQGPLIQDGQTLTTIWLTWYAHHPSQGTGHGVGMGIALGVIMGEPGWTAADVPDPWESPNLDWIWYEPGYLMPQLVSNETGVTQELDVYPIDNSRKTKVRSQRKAPAGGANVWFITSNSTLSPGQSSHFLCLSYSCGVLVAP